MPSLMWLFILPFVSAGLLFALSNVSGKTLKYLAVGLSLLPLILLLVNHAHWLGSQVDYAWFPAVSIAFHLNVDALSLLFLYLTAFIIPISLLAVNRKNLSSPHTFYGLVLLLEGLLFGFFTARDLAVFTVFWEATLLPLYFLINYWGGPQRHKAALKFLIYLLAGSALMVAAVLALYFIAAQNGAGTFNLDVLAQIAPHAPYAAWLCFIFLLAFAVKTPLFPFHAWLPDAYFEAPTTGTILLSALLSKAGIYGILRIGMELFPIQMMEWGPWLLGFSIAGVFYGGLAAWMQSDFKRLLAYSSFSHVNFILAGLFVWNDVSHGGAILQALNHGITIAALFLVAGWLQHRLETTSMESVGGLAKFLPQLCWLTMLFVLSSVALPGTNTFIGELMILVGIFRQHPWAAAFLSLTVILSVVYMLRWMQKVYFEQPVGIHKTWIDIKSKELAIALPLVAVVLWIGIYPAPVLRHVETATAKTLPVANLEETR